MDPNSWLPPNSRQNGSTWDLQGAGDSVGNGGSSNGGGSGSQGEASQLVTQHQLITQQQLAAQQHQLDVQQQLSSQHQLAAQQQLSTHNQIGTQQQLGVQQPFSSQPQQYSFIPMQQPYVYPSHQDLYAFSTDHFVNQYGWQDITQNAYSYQVPDPEPTYQPPATQDSPLSGIVSSEESTPWLTHNDTFNASHNTQPVTLPFAIPSADLPSDDSASLEQDMNNDQLVGSYDNNIFPSFDNIAPFGTLNGGLFDTATGLTAEMGLAFQDMPSFEGMPGPLPFPDDEDLLPPLVASSDTEDTASSDDYDSPAPNDDQMDMEGPEPNYSSPLPSDEDAVPTNEDFDEIMPSTTNAIVLGSENLALPEFLRAWARFRVLHPRPDDPGLTTLDVRRVRDEVHRKVHEVKYAELEGDRYDIQGLNWKALQTTRKAARERRRVSYKNYVNRDGSDRWHPSNTNDVRLSASESYYRFRRMLMRDDIHLTHFQLRSVLACPSRSQLFYPTRRGIYRLNPTTNQGGLFVDLDRYSATSNSITTLDANCGVLVGGSFNGSYVIKSLQTEDKENHCEGTITSGRLALTNHIQVHAARRSHRPVASISSNDNTLRTMDIETEIFISKIRYQHPLNCTAVSPDLRLRLHVGDDATAGVCCAETGEILAALGGHRDYGFACDWSEDGIHVATGSQDKRVKIWDARKWTDSKGRGTPLKSIWCEMAGARNLRFSPLSSGASVLVAAEEADFVSIIDLKTLDRKQTVDVFGELGGVTFSNGGDELNVLVSDVCRGGLIQLDNCRVREGDPRLTLSKLLKPF